MSQLRIEKLSKSYSSVPAVNSISLTVEKGELLAILGPSGSGKSTLLSCIAGIEKPDSGHIAINHRYLYDDNLYVNLPPEKRRIGFVFQEYALWPHMKVIQNIAYPLKIRRTPKQVITDEVIKLINLFHLNGLEQRYPHQLSGGEQQRVSIARALITNPDILLLDEPLSHLDAGLREEMQYEIRKIQQSLNLTTIHVTHDQTEAMSIADRIAVMDKGKLLQTGTPYEIYTLPNSFFVSRFVGKLNTLHGKFSFHGSDGYIVRNGLFSAKLGKQALKKAKKVFMNPSSGYKHRRQNCQQRNSPNALHSVTKLPQNNFTSPEFCIIFRPEDIKIIPLSSPEESSMLNRTSGKIIRSAYKGSIRHYWIEILNTIIIAESPPYIYLRKGTFVFLQLNRILDILHDDKINGDMNL